MARLLGALTSAFSRRRADSRLAVLERRLRQDPTDLGLCSEALGLHCRRAEAEIAAGDKASEALGQAERHLQRLLDEAKDAGWLHGVLSKSVGPKMFYSLPELTARCMRKIGLDDECVAEFDTKSEFEERATQYHFANALAILKASGCRESAHELFDEAINLDWKGQRPIKWKSLEQTPAVYIDGLEHRPFWDQGTSYRPALADVLEDRYADVLADLEELRALRFGVPDQLAAYPALVDGRGGTWDMLQLYISKAWNEDLCELAPRTASFLKPLLPTADVPYTHYNTEEVVLFLLKKGSKVRLHNGGSNMPINTSLGLAGCSGSFIEVAGEQRPFRDGGVVCFDDGSDHRVWHDGPEDRWVLVVRSMHPQLARDPGNYFSRAFTNRTSFEQWGAARAAELARAKG